ncbi:MAG: antibiotic biosynthesis monooxygenase family protein [Betaproteobacteria bacterium]
MSMFKVTIKRTAPQGKEKELLDLITQLRVKASGQQGYVSGETLLNAKVPGEFLVISVWDREVDWNKWVASEVRKALEDRIEALIGANSIYSTYSYPHLSHAA